MVLGSLLGAVIATSVLVPAPGAGALAAPLGAAGPAAGRSLAGLAPVTRAVRLERRPDIAAAFGMDLATFRADAAATLSRSAGETFGAMTTADAAALGRSSWFRPGDVELWAVPSTAGRRDEARRSRSFSVVAVPVHAVVRPDGTVAPPAAPPDGLIDPTFSSRWGDEEYFTWAYYSVDDGGWFCPTTYGRVRGQWEYARLDNVSSATYDYWGFAERAVAEITKGAAGCDDSIDWFVAKMQSRTPGAYPAKQSPLTGSTGSCTTVTLSVGGSFGGISASLSQQVQRCERWKVSGALASSASEWYGITYDNNGVWDKFQREAAALEVVRVPRGAGHGLNTMLDLDVDNR